MPLVTVKTKYQVTLPTSVRKQAKIVAHLEAQRGIGVGRRQGELETGNPASVAQSR